jgi:hypothetical protein
VGAAGSLAISAARELSLAGFELEHDLPVTQPAAATSSILDKNQEYNSMTFEQIARRVMAPTGVGVKVIGTLNARPFEREHNEVGETIWSFQRFARVARHRARKRPSGGRTWLAGQRTSTSK